jgi:outer membrane protein OmpA-like peptidoglycan-associated protein
MFFGRAPRRSNKDEAEKPFWISFSDLMTACMTLFLVVMAVTIVSLEKKYSTKESQERSKAVQQCFDELRAEAKTAFPEAKLDYNSNDAIRINLGAVIRFNVNEWDINSNGVDFLRRYIPSILASVKSASCQSYFRRVVVEGYTDIDGDYLPNLNLSLQRSQQVVRSLSPCSASSVPISRTVAREVMDNFLVGGFSFNSFNPDKAENRVVVLKLEFWQVGEEAKFLAQNPSKTSAAVKAELLNKRFDRECAN